MVRRSSWPCTREGVDARCVGGGCVRGGRVRGGRVDGGFVGAMITDDFE